MMTVKVGVAIIITRIVLKILKPVKNNMRMDLGITSSTR